MRRTLPKISDAEWEVMNLVWEREPISSVEVYEALHVAHAWKQKTVNTFLARLVEKGALFVDKRQRVHKYTSRVERDACVASEGELFLKRVFKGASGTLLIHFAGAAELTADERGQLERLLKPKKGRK